MDLKGKVAYITGGSKGIGLAVAQCLRRQGMQVAISGRNPDALEKAKKQLGGEDDVLALVSDVSRYDAEIEAARAIREKWGRLDVVLANAGVGHFASVDELSVQQWKQMVETNLTGAFHTLKSTVELLKESKGYYITVASLAGTNFFANGSGYNATKFGLVGFTQAAMLDLRKYDIKVTTIMPGSVATNFNGNAPTAEDSWKIQPEDIAKLVLDLLAMHPRTLPSKIEVRPSRPDLR